MDFKKKCLPWASIKNEALVDQGKSCSSAKGYKISQSHLKAHPKKTQLANENVEKATQKNKLNTHNKHHKQIQKHAEKQSYALKK